MKQTSNRISSITFFFPYKYPSGVSALFARMAEYISENYGLETFVVDYCDGFISERLKNTSKTKLKEFKDGLLVEIPSDTILIMQSVLPYTMRPELRINPDTRIIFWTLHPFNLIPTIIPLPFFRHLQTKYLHFNRLIMNTLLRSLRNKLQDLIRTMLDNKSIFFVDGVNFQNTMTRLNMQVNNPIYMQVLCEHMSVNKKITTTTIIKDKDSISFCWLGRLVDFKINILIYTIKKLSEYSVKEKRRIDMHIIGDGPNLKRIKKLNFENDYFKIIFMGVLTGQLLDDYLLHNIDVLTAMGTSALEGAKLGVPTILLDISYGTISKDYKFKWLFESQDYNVGEIIGNGHYLKNNGTLNKAIDAIFTNYEEISCKTFNYYIKNHSITTVAEKFISTLNKATFTYGDFNPDILKKSIIRKLYEAMRKRFRSLRGTSWT